MSDARQRWERVVDGDRFAFQFDERTLKRVYALLSVSGEADQTYLRHQLETAARHHRTHCHYQLDRPRPSEQRDKLKSLADQVRSLLSGIRELDDASRLELLAWLEDEGWFDRRFGMSLVTGYLDCLGHALENAAGALPTTPGRIPSSTERALVFELATVYLLSAGREPKRGGQQQPESHFFKFVSCVFRTLNLAPQLSAIDNYLRSVLPDWRAWIPGYLRWRLVRALTLLAFQAELRGIGR